MPASPQTPIPVASEQFLEYLRDREQFVIASHEKPDGDCIFSSLALYSFLKRRGKEVLLYNPGPFARREIRKHKSSFSQTIPQSWSQRKAVLVLIDCASKSRVRLDDAKFEEAALLVIDHHHTRPPNRAIEYICPAAPATTLIVQSLIEQLGELTKNESYYLLLGFLTDSGFFRHLNRSAAQIFPYITRLLVHEHSLRDLYRELFGNQSFGTVRFTADIILNAQSFLGGRLVVATRTKEMSDKYGIGYMNNEQANAQLQLIKGVEVTALITEISPDLYDVSLRALGSVNVAKIAEEWDGGGHIAASGFRWNGSLDGVQMQLIHRVGSALTVH